MVATLAATTFGIPAKVSSEGSGRTGWTPQPTSARPTASSYFLSIVRRSGSPGLWFEKSMTDVKPP